MPDVTITTPMRCGELARLVGWNTRRMRRLLDRLSENDPAICVRVNGHRRVTIAALRKVWPDFAKHLPTTDDIQWLSKEHEEHSDILELVAKRVGELHSAVATHTMKIAKLEAASTRQQARLDKLGAHFVERKSRELVGQLGVFA